MIASGSFLVASCSSFPRFSSHLCHSDWSFLGWNLKVFPCLDLVKFGVYGKLALSSFQQDWSYAILSSMQETAALGSRALKLISIIRTVFPSFPVGSEMLFANRENHIVDKNLPSLKSYLLSGSPWYKLQRFCVQRWYFGWPLLANFQHLGLFSSSFPF